MRYLICIIIVLLSACGGGGSGPTGTPRPPCSNMEKWQGTCDDGTPLK